MTSNTFPSSSSADRLAALFDGAETGGSQRPWWRRGRRAGFVAVGIALLLVVLLATNAFGSDSTDYRTAVVEEHDVDSLLTGVATIEPVSQATVAFPVSGTVSTVNVKVGDQVAVGQTLATLDAQSLIDTFHTEEAAMAQAKLNLSKALSGQSVGAGGGGAGGTGSTGGSGNASLSSTSSGSTATAVLTAATSTDTQLASLQQAVVDAQQAVDAALAASKTALDNATSVCSTAGSTDVAACQTALSDVQTAQNAVDTAQHKLADASTALDNYLNEKASAPTTTPSTTPATGSGGTGGSAPSSQPSSGTGSAGGFGGAGGGSSAPTAADIASYQAAVDAATANLAAAYQALGQATITSPIQGTVVAAGLTPGATVSAASTTANVVVQGAGGFEVTTSVDVNKISNVAVGQAATLVADGSHTALPGKVTSLSVAPTSTSGAATSYRVVVGLDNPNQKLGNGSTGTVTIVTKSAKAALAVPTSALTPVGNRYTVNVLEDGTTKTVVVNVGVVGTERTEITSGLTKGQEVVLADVSEPLPSSATSSSNGTTGGTTGFPGGAGAFRIPSGARPGG